MLFLRAAEVSLTLNFSRKLTYINAAAIFTADELVSLHMNLLDPLKIHTMTEIAPGIGSHVNV